ncbi:uncharacterized protein LOC123015450 [Tribolium madens]|uniref:uncharacterized protein LOC123015450 n=1 Tax=Tribolium madens TaxID=41895 RepID=UPI001CF74555|nr:uncharacterized protein LOC123015450 [Tribolium madens]
MSPFLFLFTYLLCVQSAPTATTTESPSSNEVVISKKNETYDVSQFDEVYDQRQNGSENYRLNVNKVVLVWTPPGSLLTAAMLLDPSLYEPEFGETDFFKPESEEKPENLFVVKPETTKAPEASSVASADEATTVGSTKRKLKLPGFLRPYRRRQQIHQ